MHTHIHTNKRALGPEIITAQHHITSHHNETIALANVSGTHTNNGRKKTNTTDTHTLTQKSANLNRILSFLSGDNDTINILNNCDVSLSIADRLRLQAVPSPPLPPHIDRQDTVVVFVAQNGNLVVRFLRCNLSLGSASHNVDTQLCVCVRVVSIANVR